MRHLKDWQILCLCLIFVIPFGMAISIHFGWDNIEPILSFTRDAILLAGFIMGGKYFKLLHDVTDKRNWSVSVAVAPEISTDEFLTLCYEWSASRRRRGEFELAFSPFERKLFIPPRPGEGKPVAEGDRTIRLEGDLRLKYDMTRSDQKIYDFSNSFAHFLSDSQGNRTVHCRYKSDISKVVGSA